MKKDGKATRTRRVEIVNRDVEPGGEKLERWAAEEIYNQGFYV